MSVYHQIGHDSENLLFENGLNSYKGAILSPLNYTKSNTIAQVGKIREELSSFEVVFDPQLYYPASERPKLKMWDYYPQDVDTADTSSFEWWKQLVDQIVASTAAFHPDRICSPAMVPKRFANSYYELMVQVADYCHQASASAVSLTAIVGMAELTAPNRATEIASILSRTTSDSIYLVLVGDVEPRRELSDPEELKGAMRLIRGVVGSGMRVLVGYASTDIALWSFAGAQDFATGKFFNLRRFTSKRFEEPKGGGGQLPYWLEENLMALLRESDLLRVEAIDMLSGSSGRNPYSDEIFEKIEASPPKPWLALAWRHYLWWFADFEARCNRGLDVKALLLNAERNWLALEDSHVLMEEPRNDGTWIRSWRRALNEAFTGPGR